MDSPFETDRGGGCLGQARSTKNLFQQTTTEWSARKLSNVVAGHRDQVAQIGEFRIHYEKLGNGPQAVFLMPGALGTTRTDFAPQLENLDRSKYTIIAWDPPGYGYSRPPDRTFPLHFFKRDSDVAAQFLQQELDLQSANVIGWSDGGNTGMILAATHPTLVKKLVIFGANSYVTEEDLSKYEIVGDVSAWSDRMRQPMERVYGREYFQKTWTAWIDAMAAIYKENDGNICKDLLSQIVCPTLLIHGKKDAMVPQCHPDYLRSNIKNVRYVEFKDGKHNLHFKLASQFNQEVDRFFSE